MGMIVADRCGLWSCECGYREGRGYREHASARIAASGEDIPRSQSAVSPSCSDASNFKGTGGNSTFLWREVVFVFRMVIGWFGFCG